MSSTVGTVMKKIGSTGQLRLRREWRSLGAFCDFVQWDHSRAMNKIPHSVTDTVSPSSF